MKLFTSPATNPIRAVSLKDMRTYLILLLSAFTLSVASQPKITSRPNMIFILADDLGYGDLGCYGQMKIETPNIDALARDGMRFTQFYAGTAVCAPSRASLMTGRHTGHTPVRGNREIKPEGQFPLPDSTVTIARLLQDHGYVTADFGKWGLGYPGSSGEPLKQGFSFFYGYNCQRLAHNYYPDHLWQNDQRVELDANKMGDSIYSADLIHRHAMEFLRGRTFSGPSGASAYSGPSGSSSASASFGQSTSSDPSISSDLSARPKDKPFFLYLSYTLPHAALNVPHDEVYDHYVRKFHEQPRDEAATPKFERAAFEPYPHAAYAAMVARLDRYVGEIRAELEKQGLADNTLVIFSSDNGPHREGGNDPDFFDSNGPWRGIKRDLYEGGIRVPFIACWPGKIRPGKVSGFTGAFWDIYPTLRALGCEGKGALRETGGEDKGELSGGGKRELKGGGKGEWKGGDKGELNGGMSDGVSILPTLLGQAGSQQQHIYLYWEFHENGGRQSVRWGN
jgi:arylsulfatase A-like enzyme